MARDIAWVVPANLHLTLKFLGAVDEGRVGAVVDALARASAGASAFDTHFRGVGGFPSATRPRVVWAGVTEGAGATVELAGRVDEELAGLGFAREARPFSPHVTLGRVRQPGRNPALADALEREATRDFGGIRIAGACLMRSEISPRGARYTELATVRLGGEVGRAV